jgi:D-beta-D-heptose 7-phosphate kinase/D-beta-D-heptose 1-phosphate adenosyltransferase
MNEVLSLLHRLSGTVILCTGDIMLDHFVYGDATRLSPEAPIPVVLVKRKVSMPGGMGNVVRNLGDVGVLPLAVSVAGDDSHARELSELFIHAGWLPPLMVKDPGRKTSVKTRIIAGRQQVVRVDEETVRPLDGDAEDKLIATVGRHVRGVKGIILSDYGKGIITPRFAREVISFAKAGGIPVAVDPKGKDYSKYHGATLVTPNRMELFEATGLSVSDDSAIMEAGTKIMLGHDIENLMITKSEEGMLILRRENGGISSIVLPAMARDVADVSGAGDTVIALAAASLAVGASLLSAAQLATMAAGVVVGKIGTATATPKEIEEAAGNWEYLTRNTRILADSIVSSRECRFDSEPMKMSEERR